MTSSYQKLKKKKTPLNCLSENNLLHFLNLITVKKDHKKLRKKYLML